MIHKNLALLAFLNDLIQPKNPGLSAPNAIRRPGAEVISLGVPSQLGNMKLVASLGTLPIRASLERPAFPSRNSSHLYAQKIRKESSLNSGERIRTNDLRGMRVEPEIVTFVLRSRSFHEP